MNKIQKKRLYESIMRSVSKTVKRKLNENMASNLDAYNLILSFLNTAKIKENKFKNNYALRRFGVYNVDFLNSPICVSCGEPFIECYTANEFKEEYNKNPQILENLETIKIFFFIPIDEYTNENEDYIISKIKSIAKNVANKYLYEYINDGYHIEIYHENNLNTIDDLNNVLNNYLKMLDYIYHITINYVKDFNY